MGCKRGIQKDYFPLPELAAYSGLGIRFLREAIKDPEHPLPHFRINKKTILVSRLEFAEWLETFRAGNCDELNHIVDQVIMELSNKSKTGPRGQKWFNGVCNAKF